MKPFPDCGLIKLRHNFVRTRIGSWFGLKLISGLENVMVLVKMATLVQFGDQ